MAIHIYCTSCYTSNGLNAKSCSNCGAPFGRDKKYRVCVSVKGNRATRVVDNLTLARQKEATFKADLEREDMDIRKKKKKAPTMGEVWARYLPWARANKKSWKDDNWNYTKHIEPRFSKKPLDAISPIDLERLKTELRKGEDGRGRPYAAQTVKHQLCIIRRLYNLARKWGLYDGKNPVGSVTMPRIDNGKTERLSNDELARLLNTLETWPCKETAAFIKFALFTGLRKGEICKLEWGDCDLDRGLLTLRDAKSGRTEHVPVSMEALEVLRTLEPTSPFVFPGAGGKRRSNFSRPWQKIRRAAGLPEDFRFHGMRHNFASTLVSHGIDLMVVQKLLCHKTAMVTQRYAHLAPGAIRDAALKSGDLLTPKPVNEKTVNLAE
ncbi:MAG: site-specific integrase [Thermodesulfobacteriota bacterium]